MTYQVMQNAYISENHMLIRKKAILQCREEIESNKSQKANISQ